MSERGTATTTLPRWMPSPFDRAQHLVTRYPACCHWIAECGEQVADYRADDPRVPWPTWPRCHRCTR